MKFEEVIRLAFETAGTEGIKQAAAAIAGMGDVSEEVKQQAAGLLDEIGNVEKAGAAARQYEQIGKQLLEYQRQISAARAKVLELAAAVKESDAPTKAQQRELAKARATLSDLVGEQQRELGTLRELKAGLNEQGVSTRNAAAAQKDLAGRTAAASASLRDMVGALKAQRTADAAMQAELAAAAGKSREKTEQYDAALKKVRAQLDDNRAAAKQGGAETVASMETTTSAVGRLKSALLGLTAYFSLRGAVDGVKSLLGTGDQFEKFEKQLSNMYGSAAKGAESFAWVKQFAKDTPLTLGQVMQSFIQLKNFGIDPMAGTLQAAVDQNAKLGGESERLTRITLAMGQAFAKGKLQGDDIKQMIEAGVPVWELLSDVTGKNVQQLQKMSEAGALGKDVMEAFFRQMGESSLGAASEQMETLSGQFSNLQDNVEQFQDRVAKKGVLDYFKNQLADLNKTIGEMAKDGRLDRYAKRISDSIIGIAQAVKSGTSFIVDHASQIKKLAQAYIGLKLARVALEVIQFTGRLVKLTTVAKLAAPAAEGLSISMAVLRGAVILLSGPIGLVIGGLTLFATTAKLAADAIVDYASRHNEAAAKLAEADEKYKKSMAAFAELYGKRAKALEQYANVHILAADQVAKLSEAEREAYKKALEGHEAYVKAREHEAQLLIASGTASEAWVGYQKEMQDELAKTTAGISAFSAGAKQAADAASAHLSVGAAAIKESLGNVSDSAEQAASKLAAAFDDFGKKSPEEIGNIGLALAGLAGQAGRAGEVVRDNLHKALAGLSGEDLLNFQTQSSLAFTAYNTNVRDAAALTEATLQVALERLGVSAEQWGLRTTDAGQQNIAMFQTVATNAAATADTIEAAFNKALANATTASDAEAIGAAMAAAGEQGRVGFDSTQRAVAAVENRVRALKTALDPLADSFALLGIKSQRALDDAAAAARTAFDNIVQGSRDGEASMNDVRAAFEGYARAQLDSVAHAEVWKREQVKNQLEVQASILGVSDELAAMGLAGMDAGDKVAHGAHVASDGLRGTASAAREASDATSRAGDDAASYAEKSGSAAKKTEKDWIATGQRSSAALSGLSDTFLKALASMNQYASMPTIWRRKWTETVNEWQRETDALNEQLALLDKQNAKFDELTARVETLRQTYKYLNDDQLRALATAEKRLADNQKRAEDEARQKAKDAQEKNAAQNAADTERWNKELGRDGTAPTPVPATQRIALDLNVSAKQVAGAVPAQISPVDVQRIANEVVRAIGMSRTVSNR